MNKNYIGITGFVSIDEIRKAIDSFSRNISGLDHALMIGLLISPRNINKEWKSTRYPLLEKYNELIESAYKNTFNTLHIDSKTNSEWDTYLIMLCKHFDVQKVGGFQINVMHPKLSQLENIRKQFDDKDIIIQYSNDFLSLNLEKARSDFKQYAELVDHVLIDPSRGIGLLIDVKKAMEHYKMLVESFDVKVGFAGGFNTDNIDNIINEIKTELKCTKFSIDVETGIRDSDDLLSIPKMEAYIDNACKAMKG